MSVTIDGIIFDRARYDADADILYLHVGESDTAVDFDETCEGHAIRFDADGRIVGLTLVGPRRLLECEGELEITLPVSSRISADQLREALAA